jgi:hypothetical protein
MRIGDWLTSLVLAAVLVVVCRQVSCQGAYAPHPAYRAQVDALLDGRLALTTAPDGLIHDLAWTPSGVAQVWGLGVPLWQLPFEALGRLVGFAPIPDRVPLALWLAIALFAVVRAFRPRDVGEARPDDQRSEGGRTRALDSRAMQIGAVLLTALLPALLAVLRGRIGVYEEAAIYAYGAAMILLGGTLAVVRRPTTARYLALLAFAGLTGLVRPTVWFYGLAAALVASSALLRQRGRPALRAIAVGLALFVAGGALLYASNARRFGSGFEFGHRLNVHSLPGNIVATRFSYPFERAGTLEATEELVGSLFDGPERRSKRGFYQTGLSRGQSALPRWREYYFTTFSWPYAPAIAAGLVLAALAWRRRGDPFARTLGAWAVLGGAPLFAFYLHAPSVSSRYQLDLAPAIAALLVIAWRAAVTRWPRRALAVLVVLWVTAVATSKITRPRGVSEPVDRDAAASATYAITHAVAYDHALPRAYDHADPLVPMWLDALDESTRCSDALGAPIACDAPAMPGDTAMVGRRDGRRWILERHVIPDEPDEMAPLCRLPGEADDGGDGGVCRAPTIAGDPAAVHDETIVGPPTLYLNGFGWDLATLRVPPATLFYVEDPAYLALDVTGPPGTDWDHAVRAAIGLERLRLVAVADTRTGARLRFAVGRHPGLQIAFIAFGSDRELDRPQSQLGLRSIRWRD